LARSYIQLWSQQRINSQINNEMLGAMDDTWRGVSICLVNNFDNSGMYILLKVASALGQRCILIVARCQWPSFLEDVDPAAAWDRLLWKARDVFEAYKVSLYYSKTSGDPPWAINNCQDLLDATHGMQEGQVLVVTASCGAPWAINNCQHLLDATRGMQEGQAYFSAPLIGEPVRLRRRKYRPRHLWLVPYLRGTMLRRRWPPDFISSGWPNCQRRARVWRN
jgi:hypothetical protein